MGMFLYTTMGMEWEWKYGYGNGIEKVISAHLYITDLAERIDYSG